MTPKLPGTGNGASSRGPEHPPAADTRDLAEVLAVMVRQLPEVAHRLRRRLVSVQLDGSYVRGDFLPQASDLDLTITLDCPAGLSGAEADLQTLTGFFTSFSLPPRSMGTRPLFFDLQWQTLQEVTEIAARSSEDWSPDHVPTGYPKLWLYAFDQREHHRLLYGQDLTPQYTVLPPVFFASLRLVRIRRAVLRDGCKVTDYDHLHGTITQMKHAWEAVRAAVLLAGGASLRKERILADFLRLVPDFPEKDFLLELYSFYQTQKQPDDIVVSAIYAKGRADTSPSDFFRQKQTRDFRHRLASFTIALLKRLGF